MIGTAFPPKGRRSRSSPPRSPDGRGRTFCPEPLPRCDAAKVTERFQRINYGSMEMEVTVDDPKAYTKPWTVKFTQRIMPDAELIEFICSENDTSPLHMVGK